MSPVAETILLSLVPLWPLLLATAFAVPALRAPASRLVPLAPLPALLAALLLTTDAETALPWLMLGSSLGIDDTARIYLLFSALLWAAGCLSLRASGARSLCGWFLVTMTANFTVVLAQDIPTFFLAYAVMSLATFGLIVYRKTPAARRAAKVYLVFAVAGEMILLTAMAMVANDAGNLDLEHIVDREPQHLLMALLFIGFGLKAGVPLLHMALPPAYAAAPLAAAVPVAGALLHLGLFGWMRFLPLGQAELPGWSMAYAGVGMAAIVFGTLVGLTQRQARSLLAYSSISQGGVMMLGIGAGLASADGWPMVQAALLLYAMQHALAKGALFHGLGIRGIARTLIALPALALAGMPFTGGALAKGMLKSQLHLLPEACYTAASWLLPLGSFGTALLMARMALLTTGKATSDDSSSAFAWWLLLAAVLVLPHAWIGYQDTSVPLSLWSSAWPLLLAAAVAATAYRLRHSALLPRMPSIPPGDILVPIESWLHRLPMPRARHPAHAAEHDLALHPRPAPALATRPERLLGKWSVSITLLVVLVLAFLALLGFGVAP